MLVGSFFMFGIFLDTESTGLDFRLHGPIEIAFQIIDLSDGTLVTEYQEIIYPSKKIWENKDPNSLLINGFSWEEVSKGKKTSRIKKEILAIFNEYKIDRKNAIFICQNPSFDRVMFSQIISSSAQEELKWPYHWLDLASMYWSRSILENKIPWEKGVSKDVIAKAFQLPSEDKPHRAMNGVKHLIICYETVVGFPLKKGETAPPLPY